MQRPKCFVCGKTIWCDYYETLVNGPVHDDCRTAGTSLADKCPNGKRLIDCICLDSPLLNPNPVCPVHSQSAKGTAK
jgi:hypothetical protein